MPFITTLPPDKEREFQAWLHATHAPFDPSPQADYDMRGFWTALRSGDPRATTAINASDKQVHFPDTWKTPYHRTFSSESIYARPGEAPTWHGDVLVSPSGRIVADERPVAAADVYLAPSLTPSVVRAKRIPDMPPLAGYTVNHYIGPQVPEMPGPDTRWDGRQLSAGGGETADMGGQ